MKCLMFSLYMTLTNIFLSFCSGEYTPLGVQELPGISLHLNSDFKMKRFLKNNSQGIDEASLFLHSSNSSFTLLTKCPGSRTKLAVLFQIRICTKIQHH